MIPSVLHGVRRLRGRSAHELGTRAAQAVAAVAERYGLSAQARLPDDAAFFGRVLDTECVSGARSAEPLLAHFRARTEPRFFAAFDDPAATITELRARWPAAERATLERADRAMARRFDLLGQDGLSYGEPIDWHLDPLAARRGPALHWSRVPYLDAAQVGDHKLVWEINRHQYFTTLGQAYWYTGDERYAEVFIRDIESWMDANPPKLGINWASSLEVAFRAISWTWALHFFRDSSRLAPPLFARILKYLWVHGRHVETYLSTYFSPNTHLTGEALGLFYLGALFPELRDAQRWRETGLRVLAEQLDVHVLPDGVYVEQATYYHRYTADFYLHLLALAQASGIDVPAAVPRKLEALLDHLMYLTRPDGTTPLIGDDDGGRLVQLGGRPLDDFRATLATGAVLLSRPDYRFVAGDAADEALWLLGPEGMRAWDALTPAPPPQTSAAFPAGGYYVMRDGWDAAANYLVVDCGPHGFMNGGHAHADALAIDAAADGQTVLVDPGTYSYTSDPELRTYFRSSLAHNTVAVDGTSQSVPGGAFQWEHTARAEPRVWIARERFDFFEGAHDGYARLADPAVHSRAILFLKGDYWIVHDRIDAAGEHAVEARYHFAPGTAIEPLHGGSTVVVHGRAGEELLRLAGFGEDLTRRCGEAPVSPGYGRLAHGASCAVHTRGTGIQEISTLLLPPSAGAGAVHEMKCTGGRAIAVASADWADRLLLRERASIEVAGNGISSAADWAWVRKSQATDVLTEYLVLDGTRLEADGVLLIEADAPVRYLAVRVDGDVLYVEADSHARATIDALGTRRAVINDKPRPVDRAGRVVLSGSASAARGMALDKPEFARVD